MLPTYPYSIQADRVITWAKGEAKRLNHGLVEPEHLLLGMVTDKNNVAHHILRAIGVDLRTIQQDLEIILSEISNEGDEIEYSDSTKKVLELGMQSAGTLYRQYLGTEHILIGLLRQLGTKSYSLLRRSGANFGEVLSQARVMPPETLHNERGYRGPIKPGEPLTVGKMLITISPVFWGLVGLTLITGFGLFANLIPPDIGIFVFVTIGWVVSVSLHEFGHALAAYLGGDHSVIGKGYLTLNPLRYTHGFMSIVLPVLFLAIGGIGLPGGAVYINLNAISKKRMRSLVSAAGPIMTGLVTLILAIPFILELHVSGVGSPYFWIGMAFLVFTQITALLLNLIPLPGLDGFNIIRPFLPPKIAAYSQMLGGFSFVLLFMLLVSNPTISQIFWDSIINVVELININFNSILAGFELYRFWR